MNIYMLQIPCRLSRFLAEWSFRAKIFPAPGYKNVLSYKTVDSQIWPPPGPSKKKKSR